MPIFDYLSVILIDVQESGAAEKGGYIKNDTFKGYHFRFSLLKSQAIFFY